METYFEKFSLNQYNKNFQKNAYLTLLNIYYINETYTNVGVKIINGESFLSGNTSDIDVDLNVNNKNFFNFFRFGKKLSYKNINSYIDIVKKDDGLFSSLMLEKNNNVCGMLINSNSISMLLQTPIKNNLYETRFKYFLYGNIKTYEPSFYIKNKNYNLGLKSRLSYNDKIVLRDSSILLNSEYKINEKENIGLEYLYNIGTTKKNINVYLVQKLTNNSNLTFGFYDICNKLNPFLGFNIEI